MSGLDLVIAGIFLISIIVGVMRGLIKEALSVISWIAAIWLAITFNTVAGDWFGQFVNIPNATFRGWIGFSLVFVIVLFVFAILNFAITKLLVRGPIKGTDRVLGIFFGAARAALIIIALVVVLSGVGMADKQWWQDSKLVGFFVPAAEAIEPLIFDKLPESAADENSIERKVLGSAIERLGEPNENAGQDSDADTPNESKN